MCLNTHNYNKCDPLSRDSLIYFTRCCRGDDFNTCAHREYRKVAARRAIRIIFCIFCLKSFSCIKLSSEVVYGDGI